MGSLCTQQENLNFRENRDFIQLRSEMAQKSISSGTSMIDCELTNQPIFAQMYQKKRYYWDYTILEPFLSFLFYLWLRVR